MRSDGKGAKKVMIGIFLGTLFLPGILFGVRAASGKKADVELKGYFDEVPTPQVSLDSVKTGEFQSGFTNWFNSEFPPRGIFIKTYNSLRFDLFGLANNIIGKVATGNVQNTGTISGDMASQVLTSYMGFTAIGSPPETTPKYTDVEIGGGRITGIETAPGGGQSIQFAMYHTNQYEAPHGDFTKVVSADGETWYKQYAQATVERTPYKAPDNTVAYNETIVQRMPEPPRRKDKN